MRNQVHMLTETENLRQVHDIVGEVQTEVSLTLRVFFNPNCHPTPLESLETNIQYLRVLL